MGLEFELLLQCLIKFNLDYSSECARKCPALGNGWECMNGLSEGLFLVPNCLILFPELCYLTGLSDDQRSNYKLMTVSEIFVFAFLILEKGSKT